MFVLADRVNLRLLAFNNNSLHIPKNVLPVTPVAIMKS